MILQAGIQGFVDWFRLGDDAAAPGDTAAAVFGAAPRALAGVITPAADRRPGPARHRGRRDATSTSSSTPTTRPTCTPAVLRYAREVAFATAEVYARAAEVRGAWDARLEALVVDSVLRAEADEAVLSRASALGWAAPRRRARRARARARRSAPRPTSSTRYAARPGPRAWTPCAPPRATGSW